MAVYIKTNNPKELFEDIKKKISEIIYPHWRLDQDGDLEYDNPDYKAWLRVYFLPKNLTFGIIGAKDKTMKVSTYAALHSEIIKFMLNFFDDKIITIRVTPQLVKNIDKF